VVVEEKDPSLLTCCNGGCNQKYREEENHDEACRHHAKGPVFWDGGKFWACCPNEKKWEWEDFIAIPGCVIGRHSNVPPEPIPQEEINNTPILVTGADSNATTAQAEPEPEPEDDMEDVPVVDEDGNAICGNHAGGGGLCKCAFNVNSNNDDQACRHHPSAPVFHDGKKGYSCCNTYVYDFDDFMRIPPCAVGPHKPTTKKVKKTS